MLIPLEWLREFVALPVDADALAERLTLTGNEIEEVRTGPLGPVLSLKLTPNRPDLLSLRGVAREVGALYELPVADLPPVQLVAAVPSPEVSVTVLEPELCPRYVARIVRGLRVGPSPEWLRRRLEAVGIRSISNVVDITNYVMFETGQPLHAFDLSLLAERRIVVRTAREGERLLAIDGTDLQLRPEMLVIADGRRPVALAGVMGGRDTEVSSATTEILLEAACFQPASVRRTSRLAGLASPSSYRFERGVDVSSVRLAAERAAQLIVELAGGEVSETAFDLYPQPATPSPVPFRPQRCRDLLGATVGDDECAALLERLGLRISRASPAAWQVTPPPWRPDLTIEEDLVEEVGRLHGYEHLPETLPGGTAGVGRLSDRERFCRLVREVLPAHGLFEAVTSTLVSSAFLQRVRLEYSPVWPQQPEAARPVGLLNPLSEEFDTLRPGLLPGLLQAALLNLRRGRRDVFLFEVGYAHAALAGSPCDRLLVSGLLLGSRWSHTWNPPQGVATDFFAARAAAAALPNALRMSSLAAERAAVPALHPGRAAWLLHGGTRVGVVGELHPEVAVACDAPRGIYVFELDAETLLAQGVGEYRVRPPSRFPLALRDLALVVPVEVPAFAVEQVLRESLGDMALEVRLFDAYSGSPLPPDRVSLAYALELGADDRTLTDKEIDERLAVARERLAHELGAELRT